MLQRDEVVVVDHGALASRVDLGVDLADQPEELQRLVDEAAPEVEEQPAAFVGAASLAPAVAGLRAPALEARLEAVNAPDSFASNRRRSVRKSPSQRRF